MSKARRSSMLQTQTSEPLIVVEENEDSEKQEQDSCSSDEGSPTMNPFLLTPFAREVRKHSLPTPLCSGITASQVRRLSERSETAGPGPRQTEFLATLSTAAQQTPGGRRHSVVTISRVPSALFGRNRRESVAVFPSRVLPGRRESVACPPSEPLGSVHNLQLDIMDDIVQARKVRMKLWSTSSEKVCEVQPIDDMDPENVQRFHGSGRRYSDFVGTTLAPIPSQRRASELPNPECSASSSASKPKTSGIVCSNTDLMSILSSLSTSATEINRQFESRTTKEDASKTALDQKKNLLKNTRSNSFDIAIIYKTKMSSEANEEKIAPSNWFVKRHQPFSEDQKSSFKQPLSAKSSDETKSTKVLPKEPGKVVWDEKSGSMVDAHALGSAIEVFLRKTSPSDACSSSTSPTVSPSKKKKSNKSPCGKSKMAWFSSRGNDDSTETCDSSLCSTLKDLFVK